MMKHYYIVVLFLFWGGACSAVYRVPDRETTPLAIIQFEVKPLSAEIFIDSEFWGEVQGWHRKQVHVVPGHRHVELRAQGYIAQRFDVILHADEVAVLHVDMERVFSN